MAGHCIGDRKCWNFYLSTRSRHPAQRRRVLSSICPAPDLPPRREPRPGIGAFAQLVFVFAIRLLLSGDIYYLAKQKTTNSLLSLCRSNPVLRGGDRARRLFLARSFANERERDCQFDAPCAGNHRHVICLQRALSVDTFRCVQWQTAICLCTQKCTCHALIPTIAS